MNNRQERPARRRRWAGPLLLVLILALLAGVSLLLAPAISRESLASTGAEPRGAPAKVEPIEGSDLKRVVLTESAASRLDIQTTAVREEQVARTRTVGGEVVALPGANAAAPGAVWVQVRLNQSDLNQVDRRQPAFVRPLDDENDGEDADDGLEAEADEPPEGVDDIEDSDAGAGALYYVLSNNLQGMVPGQHVWVKLSLLDSGTSRKIVPYAAVIYDVNGGTWVYTSPEPLVFIRQSITIDYIEGDLALLTQGPPAGTQVVTVGGALLLGAETGVSK